jgi:antirestriction protein
MPYKITVDTMQELTDVYNAIDKSTAVFENTLFVVGSFLTLNSTDVTEAISFWDTLTEREHTALIYWLCEQFPQHRTLDNAINAVNRYMGLYPSFENYTYSYLVDNGYTDDIPDIISHNISWADVAHDMSFDYEIIEIENGVLIFSI